VEVSKHVWDRHRHDLEALGDLLYVWQVQLRAVARQLADAGLLHVDEVSGTWSRNASEMPSRRPSHRWSPDEIHAAVEAYAAMWRDAAEGRPARRTDVTAAVRAATGRSADSLDGVLSNISAVVQELGLDPLPAYPPRSNVPVGVRPAVRAAFGAGA
ncbi:MAG: hypothetical protein JWP31_1102, partial [Aeromicrobium sp.]|nr:hypothetical protein [Aeromicrobium sp.]